MSTTKMSIYFPLGHWLSDLTATVAYLVMSIVSPGSSCDHQGLEWFTADLLIGSLAPGQSRRRGMWLFNIVCDSIILSLIWMVKLEYLQASSTIVQDGYQILACGWSLAHWPRRCSGRAAAGLAAGHRKNMMNDAGCLKIFGPPKNPWFIIIIPLKWL